MKIIVTVLIGCILSFGQNATGSALDGEEDPTQPVLPGSKIYFLSMRNGNLMVGPRLASDDEVTVYTLERNGTSAERPMKYVISKSGVLVPKLEEFRGEDNRKVLKSRALTFYLKGFKGILIPIDLLYSKSKQKAIIDSEALEAKRYLESARSKSKGKKTPKGASEKSFKPKSNWSGTVGRFAPDKNCNGEITMFLLKNNGVLQRMPPDPYLPIGIQLSYTVKDSFLIRPRLPESSDDFVVKYSTGENGDLVPHADNNVKLHTEEGGLVSFILGECGTLIPVEEERGSGEEINYYYKGQLIYKGRQFPEIFSNSEVVVVNDEKHNLPRKGEVKEEKHSIRKRAIFTDDFIMGPTPTRFYTSLGHPPVMSIKPPPQQIIRQPPVVPIQPIISSPAQTMMMGPRPTSAGHTRYEKPYPHPVSSAEITTPPYRVPVHHEILQESECEDDHHMLQAPPRIRVRTDLFAIDEKGLKIPLIPEVTEENDIVLYKLTCKGNLVRYPPCKEPEFGFQIHFQILLDEFILVPVTKNNRPLHITYTLQENGDLIPLESNENTFKKAPGSLIYFILGKNNVLFPVQQKVDPHDGSVTFYYQDYHLLRLPSTSNKPLHFSTISRPLFAFFNGLTVITTSSKPRLNSITGSNWKNFSPKPAKEEGVSRDIFLSGPNEELIRISPFKTKSGSTVIYEMDSNGILYRSPKDKKRCIILKSYILLKEGILLPSNDTTGYMYMTSKNGDMFPYLYPDGKLEAPRGESVKYLLCEKGILLPMELEIIDDHICYFFRDAIVYKERIYCKDALSEKDFKLHYKTDCDNSGKQCEKNCKSGIKPFTTPSGIPVYYKRQHSILKRHPPDNVPSYLSYTMGSFEIQPDGSLVQIRYQDPDEEVINLMLEPNGDLLEDNRNEKKPESDYYILDVKGNLIAVDARKTRKSIYFYKNSRKICKTKLPDGKMEKEVLTPRVDPMKTPLGKDPLKLMEDPEPRNEEDEPHSMHIPVPLKSVTMPGCEEKKKCDKETTMALELEINDEVIEEIKNWAAKCDKLLSRREVEESLTDALQGLNVAGLFNENAETR